MSGWPTVRLGELITQVSAPCPVAAEQQSRNFGIFSFGRGLFPKPSISGMESSGTTLYRVRQGDFVYSPLFAFEGAFGLVSPEFDGLYVSNEYPRSTVTHRSFPNTLVCTSSDRGVWLAVLGYQWRELQKPLQPNRFLTHSSPSRFPNTHRGDGRRTGGEN